MTARTSHGPHQHDAPLDSALRSGPFHLALRAAIDSRGLALQRLRYRLAERGITVGTATLSYWQSGRRRPERPESIRAVRALEEILGLPAASLTVLLGPRRPRGRSVGLPTGSRRYADLFHAAPAMDRLLAELDSTGDGKVHLLGIYEQVEIGAAHDTRLVRVLQVVRAHQDVDRYVAVYHGDPGCRAENVRLRAVQNCRLGRVRRDTGAGLVAAELLFDHRLRVGDTYLVEYAVHDPSGVPCPEYRRGFRFPAGQYVLQVRFAPNALPVRCHRFVRQRAEGPELDGADLTLGAYRTAHLVAADVRPGILGIRWDWS